MIRDHYLEASSVRKERPVLLFIPEDSAVAGRQRESL